MKKEDRKYYALPDGTLREIPEGLTVPQKEGWKSLSRLLKEQQDFMDIIKAQHAIYTDEKYPVGVVEGIEVRYQELRTNRDGDWIDTTKEIYDLLQHNPKGRRLFATLKREEVVHDEDACIYIDRAIELLKEEYQHSADVAGYNGIVCLLTYAKESHKNSTPKP